MIDCRQCKHADDGYSQLLCKERQPVMAANWRRDPRNECGLEAKLFKDRENEAQTAS